MQLDTLVIGCGIFALVIVFGLLLVNRFLEIMWEFGLAQAIVNDATLLPEAITDVDFLPAPKNPHDVTIEKWSETIRKLIQSGVSTIASDQVLFAAKYATRRLAAKQNQWAFIQPILYKAVTLAEEKPPWQAVRPRLPKSLGAFKHLAAALIVENAFALVPLLMDATKEMRIDVNTPPPIAAAAATRDLSQKGIEKEKFQTGREPQCERDTGNVIRCAVYMITIGVVLESRAILGLGGGYLMAAGLLSSFFTDYTYFPGSWVVGSGVFLAVVSLLLHMLSRWEKHMSQSKEFWCLRGKDDA